MTVLGQKLNIDSFLPKTFLFTIVLDEKKVKVDIPLLVLLDCRTFVLFCNCASSHYGRNLFISPLF